MMAAKMIAGMVLLLAVVALPGSAEASGGKVTGSTTYRDRIAIQPDARFEGTIVDANCADAVATPFGRAVVDRPAPPSVAFQIRYDAMAIDPRMRCVLRVTITVGETVRFTSGRAAPMTHEPGHGSPSNAELMPKRVCGSPRPARQL